MAGSKLGTETLALDLRNIDKSFYGVHANKGINFDLRKGEVHALLGENGAGKSTLCSIIAGLYRPDAGEMFLDGKPVTLRTPKEAFAAGVGMVYQHFRLVANLTVAENMALGHPSTDLIVSQSEMATVTNELGERYGLPVDPSARVWQLSVGQQQRVEILKLLYRNVNVLILDEPTAVLTPQEADTLFDTMRLMTAEGRSVIFVSHKLHEVKAVSDRITVLRVGENVGQLETARAEPADIARMMVGRDVVLSTRHQSEALSDIVLAVADLHVDDDRGLPAVRGIDLEVRAGEVIGIAGVSGNGQRELAFGIAGLRPATRGTISMDGRDVTKSTVLDRIKRGLAYVPQSRLGMGLAPGLTTDENLALKGFRDPPYTKGMLLLKGVFASRTEELIRDYDIRGVQPGLPISLLSGGNLQKALIAREVTHDHKVLVARSPTRGLDVGATDAVRKLVLAERDRGAGVLLISEDLDELMALSDRMVVMFEGEIVGELTADDASAEALGLLMAGHRQGESS